MLDKSHRPTKPTAGAARRVWLKYGLALLLSAAALAAGVTGIGPWPESGFVSGLILLATGPFFALRMSVLDSTPADRPHLDPVWRAMPWTTAALGLIEIVATLAAAMSHP